MCEAVKLFADEASNEQLEEPLRLLAQHAGEEDALITEGRLDGAIEALAGSYDWTGDYNPFREAIAILVTHAPVAIRASVAARKCSTIARKAFHHRIQFSRRVMSTTEARL
jgi:hypothetical protein